MAGCVLRVKKDGFDPNEYLSSTSIDGATVVLDGFNLTVSKSDNLSSQIEEVEKFIEDNGETLENLTSLISPDAPEFNFGIWRNSNPVQSVSFPITLISKCSDLGIELCASIYEVNDR